MRARVKVVKNKVAPPYRTAEFEMMHGYGASREGCLLDMGVESQLLEKSGSWFLYQGERLGQGRENAKAYLKANVDAANRLEKALREKFLSGATEAQPESAAKPAGKPAVAKAKGAE